jgi:arginyl-tRNA synthetase
MAADRWTAARERIAAVVADGLAAEGVPAGAVTVEVTEPTEAGHGDLTTNAALRAARYLRRPPQAIAAALAARWPALPEVERVEAAGPGFLNMTLSTPWLQGVVADVRAGRADFGRSALGGGRRVLLEFVSANPTGPLVAVNGRAAALGDALARLLEWCGYRVDREYYVNNAGVQIQRLGQALWLRLEELRGVEVESSWPEGVYPGAYVKDLARAYLAEVGPPAAPDYQALGAWAADRLRAEHEAVLRRFGVTFDHWTEERALREAGAPEAVVAELQARGLVREEDGALWFCSTRFGDDKDRVLVKSDGEYTYLVPDAAYHRDKFARGYDLLIDLLGPDHHGYVGRIRAIVEALTGRGEQLEIIIVQLVRLLRDGEPVRMSKRGGAFVTLEEVLDETGVDAARYFFVERAPDTPVDFDLNLAHLKTQANPVYYIQYAGARIHSLLRRAGAVPPEPDLAPLTDPTERVLLVDLARFPEVVREAARLRGPHLVARYLLDLASHFHTFYRFNRILGEAPEVEAARLALAEAVLIVLERAAELIGVRIPEMM